MAEERERTGNNAGTDGQQRDPPLQWDGGGNRGTQWDGRHPCDLRMKRRKNRVFQLE